MVSGWKYVLKQLGLILLIAILAALFLALGLVLGYGVIGDGKDPFAILNPDKWQVVINQFRGK